MFASQPIHFTSEFLAELLEQFLVQELLFERLQHPRLDLVTPDGDVVVARAFVARAETCQTVAAGHDEPSAAYATLRQAREEVPRSSRK